ncbi:MAG: hypothetical protein WCP62_10175 [Planctomycetota bacterium]|jgi:hypothetical protein
MRLYSQFLGKQLGLFALLIALWALNLFPIQRADPVLVASAVVSSQRLATLQKLSQLPKIQSDTIRWIHYHRDLRTSSVGSQGSSLEHVRLRLGIGSRASLEQIHAELQRLTEPTIQGVDSHSDEALLRAERWRFATIEHQMALFELDRARQKNALDCESLEDRASQTDETTTRAQAVTYRKINAGLIAESIAAASMAPASVARESKESLHRTAWDAMLSDLGRCSKRIERIENNLQQIKMQASGTIAITGSPRRGVISSQASLSQTLCVAAFTFLSCAGLVVYLKGPAPERPSKTSEPEVNALLSQLGLSHFGVIAWEPKAQDCAAAKSESRGEYQAKRHTRRLGLTKRLVDGMLIVWLGFFAFRFLTDANWRELLFSTPLSAFSSMVFGSSW